MSELQEADLKLRAISRERQLRLAYIQRMKQEYDQINFREGYLREGYEKGHEEGHKEGHEEGHKEGHEEGHKEGLIEGQHTLLEQLYAEGVLSREEYERRLAALRPE